MIGDHHFRFWFFWFFRFTTLIPDLSHYSHLSTTSHPHRAYRWTRSDSCSMENVLMIPTRRNAWRWRMTMSSKSTKNSPAVRHVARWLIRFKSSQAVPAVRVRSLPLQISLSLSKCRSERENETTIGFKVQPKTTTDFKRLQAISTLIRFRQKSNSSNSNRATHTAASVQHEFSFSNQPRVTQKPLFFLNLMMRILVLIVK